MPDTPEFDVPKALDALYHSAIDQVLTQDGRTEFWKSIGAIATITPDGVGELMIQLFFADNLQDIQPGHAIWVGVRCLLANDRDSILLQPQAIIQPRIDADLVDIPELQAIPAVTLRPADFDKDALATFQHGD